MKAYAYLHPDRGWLPFAAVSQSNARWLVMQQRIAHGWPEMPALTRLPWADALAADDGTLAVSPDLLRVNRPDLEQRAAKPAPKSKHTWLPPITFGRTSTCAACGVVREDRPTCVVWIAPAGERVKNSRYSRACPWACRLGACAKVVK